MSQVSVCLGNFVETILGFRVALTFAKSSLTSLSLSPCAVLPVEMVSELVARRCQTDTNLWDQIDAAGTFLFRFPFPPAPLSLFFHWSVGLCPDDKKICQRKCIVVVSCTQVLDFVFRISLALNFREVQSTRKMFVRGCVTFLPALA